MATKLDGVFLPLGGMPACPACKNPNPWQDGGTLPPPAPAAPAVPGGKPAPAPPAPIPAFISIVCSHCHHAMLFKLPIPGVTP